MANGITIATPEDKAIQGARWERGKTRLARQCIGYCIGWGYESDYIGANHISDAMRYTVWLRTRSIFNGRIYEPGLYP